VDPARGREPRHRPARRARRLNLPDPILLSLTLLGLILPDPILLGLILSDLIPSDPIPHGLPRST
jgi:hypothetical protein